MIIKPYRLPYSKTDIKFVQDNIKKLMNIGYLTDGGEYVKTFEKKFAKYCGVRHAYATNSCTTALETILKVIGVKNNIVIVPSYTFYATPLAVLNAGGSVAYADIDKSTLSISLDSIKRIKHDNIRAIIIVHVGGIISPEIMDIRRYCDKHNIILIEDCACAHGSTLNGIKAGNFGHYAAFSFHHSKVLTTGEGGMIVTNENIYKNYLNWFRSIGINREKNNWEVKILGNNYKMSEITAIFGHLLLKNAYKTIKERRDIANYYDNNIDFNNKLMKFEIPKNSQSSYYKYILLLKNKNDKKIVRQLLKKNKINCPPNLYDKLCNNQKITKYTDSINYKEKLLNSEYMKDHNLCLPMYNGLSDAELQYIVKNLNFIAKRL